MSPAERGKTVLVVEDNQLERQGLSALLQQAGYSVISAADGKEAVSKFDCAPAGPECPYDEAGHKSKVSLWFQGSDLAILKTDGDKEDEVSQWTLKLRDPDTLEITVSHITPGGADETMVFGRKK